MESELNNQKNKIMQDLKTRQKIAQRHSPKKLFDKIGKREFKFKRIDFDSVWKKVERKVELIMSRKIHF